MEISCKFQNSAMESLTPAPILINHRLTQPLLLILLTLIVSVNSVYSPLPSTQLLTNGSDCAGQIVRFSTCLPYVSSYPNNISSSASSACCDSISAAFDSGDGFCFCYLLRQPIVLGFPVNSSRILSLTSVCGPLNLNLSANTSSLESICEGSPVLPPLRSGTIGPAFTNPNSSPASAPSTPVTLSSPPDIANDTTAVKTPGPYLAANGDGCRLSFSFGFISFSVAFMLFPFRWF